MKTTKTKRKVSVVENLKLAKHEIRVLKAQNAWLTREIETHNGLDRMMRVVRDLSDLCLRLGNSNETLQVHIVEAERRLQERAARLRDIEEACAPVKR